MSDYSQQSTAKCSYTNPNFWNLNQTGLTFTLDALSEQTVKQTPTVVTKREYLVVVHREAVRDVDAESLSRDLLKIQGFCRAVKGA